MKHSRRGFTMVELMVIGSIAAVLLAILLPAVARSQEEARRTSCKNHLKQLGLALHNYHEVHQTMPPGWVSAKPAAEEGPFLGWGAFILPFMDQLVLYDRIDFKVVGNTVPEVFQTVVETYRCPSDPMVSLNPLRGKMATSSYSGNAGDERLPGSVDTPGKLNGIMWRNSRIRLRDIRDGTSNTFLAGERCLDTASGIWMGVTRNRNENDAVTDCSHQARLNRSVTSFSSRHSAGGNFLMCDGSVHFINNEIDSQPEMGVYQKLANRDDGQPVGDF